MTGHHHSEEPIEYRGVRLDVAEAVVIMLHGRGGGTESILPLVSHFSGYAIAFIAPQAKEKIWYPHPFTSSFVQNEPQRSASLQRIGEVLQETEEAGVPPEKTILLGFSQGAILVLEYAARYPQRFGAVIAFSGGLMGTEDDLVGFDGDLQGTPVYIGTSRGDTLIPVERVHQSAAILRGIGGDVDLHIFDDDRHTIHQQEIAAAQRLIAALLDD